MARFQYVARSQQGVKRRGALEAVSLDAARRALNAQGLLPESITATGTRGARPRLGGGVREAEATAFLEDLAGLLQTGVTVDRALSLVASQTEAARLAEAARDMATMVHKGRSLAEALEGYKDYLGRLTPTLVKAAEAGGAAASALADIVRQRKEQARFRRALLGALFYPGLLVCMSMICLGVLTNYVAPQFVLVFEEFDKPLPTTLLLLLRVGSLGQGYSPRKEMLLRSRIFSYSKTKRRFCMKTSRFTDSQILGILKQAQNGVPVAQLCREHGMSSATFYKWRAKFGGMDASLMARMKELERENRLLKRMYAEEKMKAEVVAEALAKNA
ncbi:hypothetical protein JCM14635_05740 [Megalodesulfovibrio paquesii]